MTNTKENKAKFFALYWGQDVAWLDRHQGYPLEKDTISWYSMGGDIHYLELTPLSLISDEDYAAIRRFGSVKEYTDEDAKNQGESIIDLYKKYSNELPVNITDYLRSRGYALPWMGLSVETIVEWGWVKLKGEKQ